jgi:hypothetical protein
MQAASGGAAWWRLRAIRAEGRKTSFGLEGSYRELDDLMTGYFSRQARYAIFANAEGANRDGRWRQDSSGQVHLLDSHEAATVAVTERYIARAGYLHRDRTARLSLLRGEVVNGVRLIRIAVTPPGGRTAILWIGQHDLELKKITLQLSTRIEAFAYADYRWVHGVRLPFRITIDLGDENETGTATISKYQLLTTVSAAALATPTPPNDVTFAARRRQAQVAARLDPHFGWLVVFARINGRGPLAFILDTGGHDIFTPAAAKGLGLPLYGSGKSYGSGSGSTPTRFTAVDSLRLGAATISHQPFTVLYLGLGYTHDAAGRKVPLSGILGLEIFERFAVTIDYASGRLVLRPRAAGPREGASVHIVFTSDMPLCGASFNGAAGVFGVDTGNNAALIVFAQWLRAHRLAGQIHYGRSVSGEGTGGTNTMRRAHGDRFVLGTTTFRNLPIFVTDMRSGSFSARSEAGNLGESVMSRFPRVTFDYAQGTLRFAPGARP